MVWGAMLTHGPRPGYYWKRTDAASVAGYPGEQVFVEPPSFALPNPPGSILFEASVLLDRVNTIIGPIAKYLGGGRAFPVGGPIEYAYKVDYLTNPNLPTCGAVLRGNTSNAEVRAPGAAAHSSNLNGAAAFLQNGSQLTCAFNGVVGNTLSAGNAGTFQQAIPRLYIGAAPAASAYNGGAGAPSPSSDDHWSGTILRAAYWPRALTNAELSTVTVP